MPPSSKQRLLITLPLIIALCAAIFYSVSIGFADLYGYSPRQHLKHWQKTGHTPTPDELEQALSSIHTAISKDPRNAEYRDMQGLLNYYQAINSYQQGDQALFIEYTQQALASYQQATRLRPNWPYSWANLALMKAMLQQYDSEYAQALTQAMAFGPWENDVNIVVAEAGMLGWFQLNSQIQDSLIKNIERGIKRNGKSIKQRLSAINKLGLACIYIEESKQRKRLCGF
ncbi:hypothetical protein EH243_13330 [Amphritea opalescens]|uniref:Tetratricopeptide repeat protein n=1 Tax=Amphritea opalescens TaxID=2490544 RepID=A0A430KNY7_9GAMM|nr:VpsP family polysaccharide biosynthesis protein [Amphritea opalescens]RTE65219.1 hypothetical protein EH243_13330 [Amphritea opalescens]